jgi:hypothetical protein
MTERSTVNPPLLVIGVVLALFGAIVLAVVLLQAREPSVETPQVIQQDAKTEPPSRLWPIVAGLSLAVGAGCIGIGMNRWRAAT